MKKRAVDEDKSTVQYSKELYDNWKGEADEIQRGKRKKRFSFI